MKLHKNWYVGLRYFIIEVPKTDGGISHFNLRANNFIEALNKIKNLGRTNEDYTKARQLNG